MRLQEVGLQVENVEKDAMELWTAAPIESEDKDTECRAAMQNTEPDEEDSDVGKHVKIWMLQREAGKNGVTLGLFRQFLPMSLALWSQGKHQAVC